MGDKKEIRKKHADMCQLLANPIRLKILNVLREGEKKVSEITSEIDERQPTTSQHLAELRKRNIVECRREGNCKHYSIANPKIMKACDLVKEVVHEQLSKNKELSERSDWNE